MSLSKSVCWHGAACGLALGLTFGVNLADARAQKLETNVKSSVFIEPSGTSSITVINPGLALRAEATPNVKVQAGYAVDIVSGASERLKAGPVSAVDIVSSATRFSDLRHVANGGLTLTRDATELSLGYGYGTENDYRSHGFSASARTQFAQKNSEIELSYAKGFDQVCTAPFAASDAPSIRSPLDNSKGCFTQVAERATRDVRLDSFQFGFTQSLSPVLSLQLVGNGSLAHGFLANPYRAVVIARSGDQALENHPENRARGALALRLRYFLRGAKTAFGLGVRAYRDTWDVFALSYEMSAEHYLAPWLRVMARGRYYNQTGALFWSDDYTGGEPAMGPRGQYWSGDRELSPLKNYLAGLRLSVSREAAENARWLGMISRFNVELSSHVVITQLDAFTWAGAKPDDTMAWITSLGLGLAF